MALPPGPRAPAAVNLGRYARRPLDVLLAWHARYGDVFTVRYAGIGTVVYVADPEGVRSLFSGDQSDLRAGEANSVMEPVVGPDSVLVRDGPAHIRQRRLLLPPFLGPRVSTFRTIIREVAEREVSTWRPGERLVLRERMRALTFEVICRAIFGVTEDSRVQQLRAALTAVVKAGSAALTLAPMRADLGPLSPGGRLARRRRAADALLYEEIATRRRASDLDQRSDVLSLLLRAGDELERPVTDAELRDDLFTMLAAGHETTSLGLTFAFDLLLHNPDVLQRLRDALVAGRDEYVEATTKEALRLRPVIAAARRTLTAPRTVTSWDLPAATKVYAAIALVHYRPDLYARPFEFRPERFLDDGAESYSWIPFGGGIRRCVGIALAQAEIAEVLKVALGRVELEPERPQPDAVVLHGVTLAPQHGVPARVVRTSSPRHP